LFVLVCNLVLTTSAGVTKYAAGIAAKLAAIK
jgi:hypothetical protein